MASLTFLPMTAELAAPAVTYREPVARGLTQSVMRKLTVSEIGPALARISARSARHGEIRPLVDILGEPGSAREMRKKPRGQTGRNDLEYAQWAERDEDACRFSRRPNAALAEQFHYSSETVRDIVQQCRLRDS